MFYKTELNESIPKPSPRRSGKFSQHRILLSSSLYLTLDFSTEQNSTRAFPNQAGSQQHTTNPSPIPPPPSPIPPSADTDSTTFPTFVPHLPLPSILRRTKARSGIVEASDVISAEQEVLSKGREGSETGRPCDSRGRGKNPRSVCAYIRTVYLLG